MGYYRFNRKKADSDEKTKKKQAIKRMVSNAQAPKISDVMFLLNFAKDEKQRMMILTGWNLALRVQELAGIRVLDFNFEAENPSLNVPAKIAKMESGGIVAILDEAYLERLLSYIEKSGLEKHDFLFNYSPKRKPYTKQHIIKIFRKIGERAYEGKVFQREKIGDTERIRSLFHPHMLRHSRARWLISRGAHPDQVKDFLRHSDVQTTFAYYGNFFKAENFKALRQIPSPKWLV